MRLIPIGFSGAAAKLLSLMEAWRTSGGDSRRSRAHEDVPLPSSRGEAYNEVVIFRLHKDIFGAVFPILQKIGRTDISVGVLLNQKWESLSWSL